MADTLTWISAEIVERLENGSFRPVRAEKNTPEQDAPGRRKIFSPLTLVKRCIRYEPQVFHHRKDIILQAARGLNDSGKKIILVGGAQGSGKTSLARGIIELMGSRNEQVLWFDINRYTDFEEIIHFLIQSIRDVFMQAVSPTKEGPSAERRLERNRIAVAPEETSAPVLQQLETLIRQVSDLPLLLVLDNVEYLVDSALRFNSIPFKEILNFLLGFPNIKMMMLGERLPYTDLLSDPGHVEDIRLAGLREADTLIFLHSRQKQRRETNPDPAVLEEALAPEAETAAIRQLHQKTQGAPWLLKILLSLNHRAGLDFYTLNRTSGNKEIAETPVGTGTEAIFLENVIPLIEAKLTETQRALLHVLGFLRHPLNSASLQAIAGICYPILSPEQVSVKMLEEMLEAPLLRMLLKINYPPQEVLAQLRRRQHRETPTAPESPEQAAPMERKFLSGYELYQSLKRILYNRLPDAEKERIHKQLHDLYLKESTREAHQRRIRLKNRALLNEARFHAGMMRVRISKPVSHPATPATDGFFRTSAPSAAAVPPSASPPFSTALSFPGFPALETNAEPPATSFKRHIPNPEGGNGAPTTFSGNPKGSAAPFIPFSGEDEDEWRFPTDYAPPDAPSHPISPPESIASQEADTWERLQQTIRRSEGNQADPREARLLNALDEAVAHRSETSAVRALLELARYQGGRGHYDSAGQALQQAIRLKEKIPPGLQAELYRMDGHTHKMKYRHNAALVSLNKAVPLLKAALADSAPPEKERWQRRLGRACQDLGEIYAFRRQATEARESFHQALEAYRAARQESGIGEIYFQLATLEDDLGNIREAIELYKRTIAQSRAQDDLIALAGSLNRLGRLYLETEAWREAEDAFREALACDRNTGHINGQLNALAGLITLYNLQKQWAQAKQTAKQALAFAIAEKLPLWQSSFYLKLGEVYEAIGQTAKALRQYQLARSVGADVLAEESLRWLDQKIKRTARKLNA